MVFEVSLGLVPVRVPHDGLSVGLSGCELSGELAAVGPVPGALAVRKAVNELALVL